MWAGYCRTKLKGKRNGLEVRTAFLTARLDDRLGARRRDRIEAANQILAGLRLIEGPVEITLLREASRLGSTG